MEPGFCRSLKKEILNFFENKFSNSENNKKDLDGYIGIAWNYHDYWFVKGCSTKPEISEEQLLKIIKPQFEVGKWYKFTGVGNIFPDLKP